MTGKHNAMKKRPVDAEADAPLTDDEFARGRAALLARRAREASGLSQSAFAQRFGIPEGTLKDWEQGRRAPDQAAQSYLRVITEMPDAIAKVLNSAA